MVDGRLIQFSRIVQTCQVNTSQPDIVRAVDEYGYCL